jgi:hypothetical protein
MSHYVVLPLSLIHLIAEGDLKEGCVMVHAVTCLPVTVEICVQSQVSAGRISANTVTGLTSSILQFSRLYHSVSAPCCSFTYHQAV